MRIFHYSNQDSKFLISLAIPYAWYIEMWIGLFLFTPFLNLLYKAIPTQKQKMVWIGILFAMTAIPDLFNRYGFHLVPGFWQTCYPLMFFFIGSYVKEYQPKINPLCGWGIIIICCLINPVFNILFVHNRPLIHIAGDPSGMFGTIIAVYLLFVSLSAGYSSSVDEENIYQSFFIVTGRLFVLLYIRCNLLSVV